MKNILLNVLCIGFAVNMMAQDSLNMKRLAVLDGLGLEYTDIWGYRHGSEEFAVIGSKTAINVINVTECSNPILTHQWVDGSNTTWRDIKDYGDYIYNVCDGPCNEGLQIINKNDYSQSQDISIFNKAHNIFIDPESGRLYVFGANTLKEGVYIYDIKTAPSTPALIKTVNFGDLPGEVPGGTYYVHDGYVENDTAYLNHGYKGMIIWDMTDLDNIQRIGESVPNSGYNHSCWKHPSEPYIYLAEEVPQGRPMYVYDISDPTDPFITHTFKDPLEGPTHTDNRPHNPLAKLNRLYISYYHDGLQIYDIKNPELPEKIAYYDTYFENNGNGYVNGSYEGAWGTYPYLPSGCILISDITHGLSTVKLTIAPEARNKVSGGDLIINDGSKGIVFITPDDEYIRIVINSNGDINTENIGSAPLNKMEVVNSNLQFENSAYGIVLRSPNGKYFRIGVDNSGNLTSTITMLDPSNNNLILQSEDLYLSQYRAGLIMKNTNGECYHFTLGDAGLIELELVFCD